MFSKITPICEENTSRYQEINKIYFGYLGKYLKYLIFVRRYFDSWCLSDIDIIYYKIEQYTSPLQTT